MYKLGHFVIITFKNSKAWEGSASNSNSVLQAAQQISLSYWAVK